MARPSLAIVIVSYNARADLERCLESLAQAPPATPHRIVVVDNASSDGSLDAVRARWPQVQTIAAGANLGFSRANNVGIRATSSDLVLLLNGDTIVPAGAIDALIDDLLADESVAVVGPRLVDAGGRPELSFGRMIGPWNELWQKVLGGLYDRRFGPAERLVWRRTHRAHEPEWVSGACLLARRADLEAVGLLDERYFLYTEDVDLCASIRARGRRIRFTPAAEVVHLRGRSRLHDRSAAAPGLSREPHRLLREAPPALGGRASGVPGAARSLSDGPTSRTELLWIEGGRVIP